jgi:hypothetical protein
MAAEFEADGGAFISQNATPASPSLEVEEVQGYGGACLGTPEVSRPTPLSVLRTRAA